LLLDEPTASVDAASAQLIKEASLKAREQWGTTLVVASHDWQWLYEVCDDVRSLFRGTFLGLGGENMVLGPWLDLGNGNWGKRLSNNQEIRTTLPPHKDAAATFDVCLMEEGSPEKDHVVLHGTLSRLTLKKDTPRVLVAIDVGNLSLTVRLSPDEVRKRDLFPGKDVSIQYGLDDVKWL
jgi:tungstate transport system ATP-binding protein